MKKFAGGDQGYLRDRQYRDPGNLSARANLHIKYRTNEQLWFPWLASQLQWPEPCDVLEVGCGPGSMWVEAADELPASLRLTLTDLSPGMVEAACQRVSALKRFAVVRGRKADAQRLPFPDRSFDVAVANHMLYHVPEPALAVSELARILRPCGRLVAGCNGPDNLKELQEILSDIFGVPREQGLNHRFGSVVGKPMLEAHFAQVEWRAYPDRLRCTDPEDVLAYIRSYPPGEDADPEALQALARAVDDRFEAEGGAFTITKDTGAFLARA